MMDNIAEITDLTRLYQLYIMTDKILNMQLKSDSGINYETLKRFKLISLRINYLHMQEFSSKVVDLKYDTKDIYEEQKKLTLLVKLMKDTYEAHNILVSKYRKYSSLPLVLDEKVDILDLEYYSDKLNSINDYIKNETYITKINDSMSNLGLELGVKTREEEELLSMIPIYEKRLRDYVLNDYDTINHLNEYGFNVKELFDEEGLLNSKYDIIISSYEEVSEKYEAIRYVDKRDYVDIIREISDEYQTAKTNKLIIEILKYIFKIEEEYKEFYLKRVNIKTNLVELGDNVFGKKFNIILKEQIDMCDKINDVKDGIDKIKTEIHKNNSLLSKIKREQTKLKKDISRKKTVLTDDELNRQIVKVDNSYINYSRERVNNVLKFVLDNLNSKKTLESERIDEPGQEDGSVDDDIFNEIDNSNDLFMDDGDNGDTIFEEISDSQDVFDSESNSETFEKIDNPGDVFDDKKDELKLYDLGNNIFNDKIDSEIYSPNVQFMSPDGSFWPNIG